MTSRRHRRPLLGLEFLEPRETPSLTSVGPEFRVNTLTQERQWEPAVAMDADGDFVIAFSGYGDYESDPGWGIFARLYQADGTPRGDQFRVATVSNMFSNEVSVAMDADGDFVVVWIGVGGISDPSPWPILARRFDADGTALSSSFQVNDATTNLCLSPALAMHAEGDFVVAWRNKLSSEQFEVDVKRYSNQGVIAGTQVIAIPSGVSNTPPAIVIAPDGTCLVAGNQITQVSPTSTKYDILARRLDGDNQPTGSVFVLNGSVLRPRLRPAIAINQWGGYSAIWDSYTSSSNSQLKTFVRTFSSADIPTSDEIQVGSGAFASIAMDWGGNFAVTWSNGLDTANSDVLVRPYGIDALLIGNEQLVNSFTTDAQNFPSIAMDADGDAVIAWRSNLQDGDSWGVFAQRYAGAPPSVWSGTVNNNSPQRSSITNTSLNFNRTLVLPPNATDAFTVTGPSGDVPFQLDLTGSTPAGTVANLVYPGGLPNGQYNLTVHASMIHDTAGQVMGADYVMSFHRLLGDFNGDARVDGNDFAVFRTAIGSQNTTFDLNGDGQVNAVDFIQFRMTFGTWI